MPHPPLTFWTVGQSFLIYAPPSRWEEIINAAISQFHISPFDLHIVGETGTVTIEETRSLGEISLRNPAQGEFRLCIVKNSDHTSDEAANALLKVLEDTPKKVHFLLLAETRSLLPTIQSRCVTWSSPTGTQSASSSIPLEDADDFATVSLKLAAAVQRGESLSVIDQWSKTMVQDQNAPNLQWLIEARAALSQTSVNAQAILETTFLHLSRHIPVSSLLNTVRKINGYL